MEERIAANERDALLVGLAMAGAIPIAVTPFDRRFGVRRRLAA